jgi:hypothetical protein
MSTRLVDFEKSLEKPQFGSEFSRYMEFLDLLELIL